MSANEKRTILVVDDEPEIRKLVGAMVRQVGCNVLTADSGEHALTLYKNNKGPIELLITDVIAPGMSGPMLADKLTELQPGLKVLYISGTTTPTWCRSTSWRRGTLCSRSRSRWRS